jgi:hypothetical protein
MRGFGVTFSAAFLGKLAGGLFLAVCAALGFGPEKWAAFVVNGLVSPHTAQIAFLALGFLTLILLLRPAPTGTAPGPTPLDLRHIQVPRRPEGTLSLHDAAQGAYAQIQGTDFASEIEEMGRSPLEIMRLTAQQFLGRGVVMGKRWPSEEYELLDGEKRKGWNILDDINSLAYLYQRAPIIRDCVVRTADIEDFVRYARNVSTRI